MGDSLIDARMLIEGASARAVEIGVPMCIAISDESGQLIAFERIDGGKITSTIIAQDKATRPPAQNVRRRAMVLPANRAAGPTASIPRLVDACLSLPVAFR